MSQLKAQRVLTSRALKRRNYSRYNDPKEVMRGEIQGRCRANEHEFPGEPPPAFHVCETCRGLDKKKRKSILGFATLQAMVGAQVVILNFILPGI